MERKLDVLSYQDGFARGVEQACEDRAGFKAQGYQDVDLPQILPEFAYSLVRLREGANMPHCPPSLKGWCEGYLSLWD